MDASTPHCIVNACVGGGWYPEGQKRLVRSLNYHGSTADILAFREEWPSPGYEESCPYNIKPSAIEAAVGRGYRRIMWLDCPVWAVQYPMPVWDVVENEGYYLWASGYNAAQTCSDRILDYFGVSRDEAEQFPDVSSSMFGINTDNPIANEFLTRWIQAAKDGAFAGSRFHDNQSQDPRFLFHRQDQSAASLLAGMLDMRIHAAGQLSSYYDPAAPASVVFLMRGI